MSVFDQIAEQRIVEAQARGEFDDLPGRGRPLDLDDDRLVPEELRMAYRILKNAGFVPPELALHAEIGSLEALVGALAHDDPLHVQALRKLELLRARAAQCGGALGDPRYRDGLLVVLARADVSSPRGDPTPP